MYSLRDDEGGAPRDLHGNGFFAGSPSRHGASLEIVGDLHGFATSLLQHLHSAIRQAHCQHFPSAMRFALVRRQRSSRSSSSSRN
jgi:hypothetical protein